MKIKQFARETLARRKAIKQILSVEFVEPANIKTPNGNDQK